MIMEDLHNPQIGKDVIESLTLGMYEDCRFIYREYIQNSADQVDKAVKEGLLKNGEEEIYVGIDTIERRISIEDNATGIAQDRVVPVLRNIAHSTKTRGVDKGFRGIGRLGGLGYCSELRFETSFKGEDVKSVMIWNAELLKNIINDRQNVEEAVDVLRRVTETNIYKEDSDKHYFRVIMEGVTDDDLLDVQAVREYLSMVAPVDISSGFIYRSKINDFMKKNNLSVDTYNIYINGEQIYKPYTTAIYEDNNGGKKKIDDILDVDFLIQKDANDEIIYWGWYSISKLNGQMKQKNIARGIRLRKENIQIGDEEICKKFFSKTEDQRFSFYYFGEIHAVNIDLIPNSRRDYFGENVMCARFERLIKADFLKLKDLCYDAQKVRSNVKTINKGEELRNKIKEKEKNGYTSQQEREDLQRQFEEHKKREEYARQQLDNMTKKIDETDSPLKGIWGNLTSSIEERNNLQVAEYANPQPLPISPKHNTIKYRTDKSCYSRYSKQERKLIGKIYASIENAIADEVQRETLINKIEEDITR